MNPVTQQGPAIILVRPQMGENIGMTARAMLNCGVTDLRLVAPRDGWPNAAAVATSSGAVSVIKNTRLYETLPDAVADRSFVIATTSRSRDMRKPVFSPETAAQAIITADAARQMPTSAIVFGPERTGLENEDLTFCDALLTIPLNPDYMSLNMAQAVLLVAYQWYRLNEAETRDRHSLLDHLGIAEQDIADKRDIDMFLGHLGDALEESGFFTTEHQRPTIWNNLRNTFQRMRMTRQEVSTFHGMVKALRGGTQWKKK